MFRIMVLAITLTIKREKDEILVPLVNDHVISIELSKRILNLNPDYYEF